MRRSRAARALEMVLLVPLVVAIVLVGAPAAGAQEADPSAEPAILLFSKTAGFRHGSISAGIEAVTELGAEHGFTVDATEDAGAFTPANLARYDAVVWLSTTGDVLDEAQQAAFEDFIEGGGGYAGIHAASDTEYSWSWYGGLVGAYFSGHPANQTATVDVADDVHPSTGHLPERWERYDEWYNFRSNPRGDVHVLASLDESTYDPGSGGMGNDHPIAWCQYYNGGRSWYTGMGHTVESFDEPAFRQHLLGGIQWAAGAVADDCGGTVWNNFQKVPLDDDVASPMGLEVAPDGRVIYIERAGQVRVIDPETSTTSTAATIPVHTAQENGLLGIVLDPDFAQNNWVYLYYSPPSADIDAPHQRLSRFTMTGDTLDLSSEKVLLRVPHQRETCCHSGGYLQFGPDGNIWIATGDDTSPSASDGYTPIDERTGRESYDAQRTSANTNDLRGKLLRITPTDDGGYTIPAGNLFAPGMMSTKPEIYAMGFRNPFRFTVDPGTGLAYVADYGPDANAADPQRGTDGRVEWNVVKEPGNFGWPYCHGGAPFVDYDFATGQSGQPFDCQNPVNDSPNNTGLRQLPPVLEPEVWYGRATAHPEIGRGGAPMAGPRYVFDPTVDSERQWPAYFDGTALFYEWGQNDLYEFHLTDDGSVHDISPLLTTMPVSRPHEMKFGRHDGALYVIEWGSGFGGDNPDAQIVRVDYSGGQVNPIAKASADPVSGSVPLTVAFSSAGTAHPQGGDLSYRWDFGDGNSSDQPNPTHTYTEEGNFTAILTVTDVQDRTGTANVTISVGNTAPNVTIDWPVDGGIFGYDDTIPYRVKVDDVEDGSTASGGIDCTDVVVELVLGHDDHGHPMKQQTGCSGSFIAERDGGHVDTDRITYVIEARYRDRGSPNGEVEPMLGRDLSVLQPSRKQAEHHDPDGNVRTEPTRDPLGGGENVGWIEDGASLKFSSVNLFAIEAMRFRVASPNATSRIEIRKNGVDGELLGTAAVPNTGGFQNWAWVEAPVVDPGETFTLYLVFRGASGYLLNLNLFDFVGNGVKAGPPADIPLPQATVEPGAPDGLEGWYVSPVRLVLDAEDEVEYRVGQGDWSAYEGPVTFDGDGRYVVDYRARRDEQVTRPTTLELPVDVSAPETAAELSGVTADGRYTGEVKAVLNASDATSGVAETHWRLAGDDGHEVYAGPITIDADEMQTMEFRSIDHAGNAEPWQSVRFEPPSGTPPEVRIAWPANGAVFPADGRVPYRVLASADDRVDCADVGVRVLGRHAGHVHEVGRSSGCVGVVETAPADGHEANAEETYVVEATYTKPAGADVVSLVTGQAERVLQPRRKQAEHHDSGSGVRTEATRDTLGGGQNVGWIRDGFSIAYEGVNLAGIEALRLRLASSSVGGTLEIRKDRPDGDLLGSVAITNTGGSQAYRWFDAPVTDPGGTFTVHLVFRATGTHYIANFNFFEFVGAGAAALPVDATPPATTAALDPEAPDGQNGWHTGPVEITLSTEFGAVTDYRIGDGPLRPYTGAVAVEGDGVHTVTYRSTDVDGNQEADQTLTVRIDGTPPAPSCVASRDQLWPPNGELVPVRVAVGGTDATSGVAGFLLDSVTSSDGDGDFGHGWELATADTEGTLRAHRSGTAARTYTVGYTVSDAAGNSAPCAAAVLVPHDEGRRPNQAPR